jgi:hypothetical protein
MSSVEFVNASLVAPFLPVSMTRLEVDRGRPSIITTNYSDTEIKLGEAVFFLDLLEQNASHQAVIYYCLSAFLSAARSVTLVLQAEGDESAGFREWYESVRERLAGNELAKYLKEQRDVGAHARYSRISTVFDVPLYKTEAGWVYRASEDVHVGFSFEAYITENGLANCRAHLELLRAIVTEARELGFLPVESKRRVQLEFRDEGKPRRFAPDGSGE